VKALVCFDTASGQRCALDVAHAGRILPWTALEPLPAPLPGVLGLLRTADGLLPVLGVLGETGAHIVVVRAGAEHFGLLVQSVTAVVRVADELLLAPPRGQERAVVRAVAGGAGDGALVLDPDVLAQGLRP
jgi:chemotaxis signal transduction protein